MAKSKGGRKTVADKRVLIGVYIPKSWIKKIGADKMRVEFLESAKNQAIMAGLKNIS